MAIKKVVMYIDVDNKAVLNCSSYASSFDWRIEETGSTGEALKSVTSDALCMVMDNIFKGESFIKDYEFIIQEVSREDRAIKKFERFVEKTKGNRDLIYMS